MVKHPPGNPARSGAAGLRPFRAQWLPILLPMAMAGLFVLLALAAVRTNVRSDAGRHDFLEGDTGHYLAIAQDFARGDFSMSYVQSKPHRQPLYPLLLAPVYRWGDGSITLLATVNVALTALAFLALYFGALHRFRSTIAAAVLGGLFLLNPFVAAQPTQHLLTEPLHLLLAISVIFAAWDFLVTRRTASLGLAFALVGLDYLARPNGLFMAIALLAALLLDAAWRVRDRAAGWRLAGQLAAGALVFIIVSAPSWVPRARDFGNPIYHGYLTNYLWVDSYAEGHVGQRFAKYSARDYFATHGAGDVALRMTRGIWQCVADIPTRIEKPLPILFLLAVAGIGLVLFRGPNATRILLVFGALQLLPLAWTNLSNPTVRVAYAGSLPFELLFAAIAIDALVVAGRNGRLSLAGLREFRRRPCPAPAG